MRFTTFAILTMLSLLYAGLTIAESAMYESWDQAVSDQKRIQLNVTDVQRMNERIGSLLQRMAVDSQRDPALTQLLKEHRINVVIRAPMPMSDTPQNAPADQSPATTPPASPNPTASHP